MHTRIDSHKHNLQIGNFLLTSVRLGPPTTYWVGKKSAQNQPPTTKSKWQPKGHPHRRHLFLLVFAFADLGTRRSAVRAGCWCPWGRWRKLESRDAALTGPCPPTPILTLNGFWKVALFSTFRTYEHENVQIS